MQSSQRERGKQHPAGAVGRRKRAQRLPADVFSGMCPLQRLFDYGDGDYGRLNATGFEGCLRHDPLKRAELNAERIDI